MKKNILEKELQKKGIPKDMYSLDGGLPNEAYCLNLNKKVWEVYYSERGIKLNLKTFDNEGEACEYFYNWVLKTAQNMNLL